MAERRFRCRRCQALKTRKEFVRDRTRADGIFPWCKTCHSARQREYNKVVISPNENGDGEKCPICLIPLGKVHRNRVYCSSKCNSRGLRLRSYGITPDEYRVLIASGKCPICNRKVKKWVLDHDHKTGETCAAICQFCNIHLLVGCRRSPKITAALMEYLLNPPVRKLFGERRYIGPPKISTLDRMWLWNGTTNVNELPTVN